MKLCKLLVATFTGVALLTSCDEASVDNNLEAKEEMKLEVENREKGQIPPKLNFLSDLESAKGSADKFMELFRHYKTVHGNTDYYNNLFELTSYRFFKDSDFKNTNAEDLRFLLDEMRSVPSNTLNLENISVLLIASQHAGVIDAQEFKSISNELLTKTKEKLENAQWNDADLLARKKEEFKKQNGKVQYQNHLNQLTKLAVK